MSEVRFPLAQVTEASLAGWQSYTKRHGGNPTVLAEVIGLYLATQANVDRPPSWLERLTRQAVDLEAKRKRRR